MLRALESTWGNDRGNPGMGRCSPSTSIDSATISMRRGEVSSACTPPGRAARSSSSFQVGSRIRCISKRLTRRTADAATRVAEAVGVGILVGLAMALTLGQVLSGCT